VTLADWSRFEPLNSDRRAALYSASPAFAEMRDYIESGVYVNPSTVAENGERKFAFLTWVLRDAAAHLGHHASLARSRAFYHRLAVEVNAACDAGAVPAVGPVGSSHPGPHRDGWRRLIGSWGDAWLALFRPSGPVTGQLLGKPVSGLEPEEEARRRRFLNERLPPPGGERQRDRLATIGALAATMERVLGFAALMGAVALSLSLLRPRRAIRSPWAWAAAAALAAITARTFVIAFIDTYWWRHAEIYLTAVSPLVAVFPVLGIGALLDAFDIAPGRVGAAVRDILVLAALAAAAGMVIVGVAANRPRVVWPLDAEQLAALRHHPGQSVVSVRGLEVDARSPGLGFRPRGDPSFVAMQVCDHEAAFSDALIEVAIADADRARMLRVRWAPPREPSGGWFWRDLLVPGGRRVGLRLPLEEGGVGRLLIEGLPRDRETVLFQLDCSASKTAVADRATAPSTRAWIHREAPRQLICEIRGAPPGSPVVACCSTRLRPDPQEVPGVEGALEIDLAAPLTDGSGGRLEMFLHPDRRGFATRTWVFPEGASLPGGPIFLQAAHRGRLLPSVTVEPLSLSPPGSSRLPATLRHR
jgi:hypothetical protein